MGCEGIFIYILYVTCYYEFFTKSRNSKNIRINWNFKKFSKFWKFLLKMCEHVCMGLKVFLNRVATCQGKVREKKNFSRSGNCQGILKKCQGILAIWPMSGKCQGILSWQLIFSEHGWHFFACIHFQVLNFLLALLHSAYIPIIPFSKCFITSMSTVLYYCFLAKTFNIDIGIFNCF